MALEWARQKDFWKIDTNLKDIKVFLQIDRNLQTKKFKNIKTFLKSVGNFRRFVVVRVIVAA